MYILKNAWTSIKRNKGRNILIGIIIIVISAASAITLAIRESANSIVKAYQEKNEIEASISMNRENLMKNFRDGDKSQEDMINSFNNIESLSEDEIVKYGESDYVKSYYYTYTLGTNGKDIEAATSSIEKKSDDSSSNRPNMPEGFGDSEKVFNKREQEGSFKLVGYNSYEDMEDFINGNYTITDGEVSSDFEGNNCVISEELATLNDIKVGDTITLVDVKDEEKTYEIKVTGIYKEKSDDSESMTKMFTNSANKIITNVNFIKNMVNNNSELKPTITPTYIIKDKKSLEKFKDEVSEKGLSEYYQVTDNTEEIASATESVDNVKVFATTFLIITLIIGGVVLVVINMINIRERKYEIGVLRTIGMKKSIVSTQFMLELLIVAVAALAIGAGIESCLSVGVANKLLANEIENSTQEMSNISKNFGSKDGMPSGGPGGMPPGMSGSSSKGRSNFGVAKVEQVKDINAVVDVKVLGELLGIGVVLTLLSSLASMIAISRFSPLTILKERS